MPGRHTAREAAGRQDGAAIVSLAFPLMNG